MTSCLVCGGTASELLYSSTYRETVADAHRYFLGDRTASAHEEIRRCNGCRFVFTARQFEEAEYDEIYRRIRSLNDGTSRSAGADVVAARARFARLRSVIASYTDFARPFLDFGYGSGYFLEAAASPAGTGFEVGHPSRRRGPAGSVILSGRWPDVAGSTAVPWSSQKLVTAFNVLEHLCNPERDVGLMRRVLTPDGYLFVTIPDVESVAARVSRRRWNMFLLEHLWYFSRSTLDRFMARHGLAPVIHQAVPYEAAIGHICKRVGETFHFKMPHLPKWMNEKVIAVPAGILLAGYRVNA